MTFKRLLLVALAVGMLTIPASSNASTVYQYAKCKVSYSCTWQVYVNPKHTRVNMVALSARCSKNVAITAGLSKRAKINSKHKFKVSLKTTTWQDGVSYEGTFKVSGTVSKRKKVKIKYSLDKFAPSCAKFKSGKATLKFKEVLSGGG